jgi:(p)ppGpp synthase/HD superfamily hydrolase
LRDSAAHRLATAGEAALIPSTSTSQGLGLVLEALHFAAERHAWQRRKGAKGEPYLNHLVEVTCRLGRATGAHDPVLLAAAVLHDVVEDTGTTLEEVERLFGPEITGIVAEVTDEPGLAGDARKQRQVERVAHASRGARLIKLADKTSNLQAILQSPPEGWDAARKQRYFAWAKAVVDAGCRGLDDRLEAEFDAVHREGVDRFGG